MINIRKCVLDKIRATIGSNKPEAGGVLFSSDGGETITDFVEDATGSRSGITYSPDVEFINNEIRKRKGRDYWCGCVHSHPNGVPALSMGVYGSKPRSDGYTYSDQDAINQLMAGLKGTKRLLFPVVQSSYGGGKFSMRMFVAEKRLDNTVDIHEEPWRIVDENTYDKNLIDNALPIKKYKDNTAIIIGVKEFEDCAIILARNGVSNFILIDSAKYTVGDLGTIASYSEIGGYVSDSVARKIHAINPLANIRIVRCAIGSSVDAQTFNEWTKEVNHSRSLILIRNDAGHDVMHAEDLAMHAKLPFMTIGYDKRFISSEYKDYYITRAPKRIDDYTVVGHNQSVQSAITEFSLRKALNFFDNPIAGKGRLAAATTGKPQASKFESLYKDEEIARKTVVIVGCGGSRSFAENLVRSGVRRLVLWDGDIYGESNLQTQMSYHNELGQNKAEAIAQHIRLIRPDAEVIVAAKMLDAKVSDEEFAAMVGDILTERPHDVLIAACTDNFKAQARCSRLALKYGTPYIQAGIYQGGYVFEIVFFHPAVSHVCPRCILHRRYDVNLNSEMPPTPAVSDGTSIFVTETLNAEKGHISLGLLLFRSQTADKRYADFMDDNFWHTKRRAYDRNFMFHTQGSNLAQMTGIKAYSSFDRLGSRLGSNYQSGINLFRKKKPLRGCPDCGGKGDLAAVKGAIIDTRDGIYSKEEY